MKAVNLNIFQYTSYRLFLADYYEERKGSDPRFSYRFFAMKAGYSSSGYYRNIVQGKLNLTERFLPGFVKGLGLNEKETEYFKLLIEYDHCKSTDYREIIFRQMLNYMPRQIKRMKQNQRAFFTQWYYPVVYQALDILDVQEDLKELAAFVNPPLKLSETRKAMQALEELHLIKKNKEGVWRTSESRMIGGSEVGTEAIRTFHNVMMDQAKEAQDHMSPEDRYVTTSTVRLDATTEKLIRTRLSDLRREIMDLSEKIDSQDRICQLNLQFFPVSTTTSGSDNQKS